jgi:prophage maintenance system killer protein
MRLLTVEELLEINETIYRRSLEDRTVEYSGRKEYSISKKKIERLVELAPSKVLLETATYYLKNIILLQAFPNANNRTAMIATELFLKYNGRQLRYKDQEAIDFYKGSFSIRSKVYGTLEQRDAVVLKEGLNEFYEYCKRFIEGHLT